MGQIFAVMACVVQLLPIVIQLLRAVEDALPQDGAGAQKLAVVQSGLQAAFSTLESTQTTFDHVWPILKPMIDALVSAYNATGIFKKG